MEVNLKVRVVQTVLAAWRLGEQRLILHAGVIKEAFTTEWERKQARNVYCRF